jgi:hypothetical protein
MPVRPEVPTGVKRLVLDQSGRRCAVDGLDVPLEVHHIDLDSRQNREANLIALCPTCHKEAHAGMLAQKIVGEFKRLPWFYRPHESTGTPRWKVLVYLDTPALNCNERFLRQFRTRVAGPLDMRPEYVEILQAEPINGVTILIKLPPQNAYGLLDWCESARPIIEEYLGPGTAIYRAFQTERRRNMLTTSTF